MSGMFFGSKKSYRSSKRTLEDIFNPKKNSGHSPQTSTGGRRYKEYLILQYKMKKDEKYDDLRKFLLENFETTSNKNDRLHTRDIINLAYDNKFLFSDGKIAEVFKTLNLGEYRKQCNINKKSPYRILLFKIDQTV